METSRNKGAHYTCTAVSLPAPQDRINIFASRHPRECGFID